MRILLINHIENARESLRSNRLRTKLTVLGIALGIASITLIMSLSQGAIQKIQTQVDNLDGNLLIVRPNTRQTSAGVSKFNSSNDYFSVSSLTEKDLSSVAGNKNVDVAAPIMAVTGSVRSAQTKDTDSVIISSTPELEKTSDLSIRNGQFFDSVVSSDTTVIGQQLSVDLFGTENSIGQNLKIKGKNFTVIGVLNRAKNSVNYNNFDVNRAAIINLEAGKNFNHGSASIRQINVKTKDGADPKTVKTEINKLILKNHDGEQDFSVLSGNEISQPTSDTYKVVQASTAAIALIALIIGGIGIMNIMLVSVAERTREIGIRKSVGASDTHILMQFMIESVIMSLSGGVAGFVLGYILAFVVSFIFPLSVGFSIAIPITAILLSLLVGTLFGMYPAMRAATKNPIEALRQYQ